MKTKRFKLSYKGEQNVTYNANAFALKCMVVGMLVFLFCWILDLVGVFIVDLRIMTTGIIAAAAVTALAFAYAFMIGIDSSSSRYVIMAALVVMATVIFTEMAYHTSLFMIFPLVCSAQYFDKRITVFTYITTCIGYGVAVMLGYRIGLCDSNMLLLTYTTSAHHAAELASGDFAINTNQFLMFLYFVFPRWLLMFAMMPLLNHVARDIQLRADREAKARHLAEIDGLTGLYNRTKYRQAVENRYPACEHVAAFYFDINNLKTVNDKRGHEYGDILICGLADALSRRETDGCKTYRLGGDEFVMILEGEEALRAEAARQELEQALQGKALEEGVVLSVAIGMAVGKGTDLEAVVRRADEQMYQTKLTMKAEKA